MTRRQIRLAMLAGEFILAGILHFVLNHFGFGGVLKYIIVFVIIIPIELTRQFDVFYVEKRNSND